jgi:hypothetical protein
LVFKEIVECDPVAMWSDCVFGTADQPNKILNFNKN